MAWKRSNELTFSTSSSLSFCVGTPIHSGQTLVRSMLSNLIYFTAASTSESIALESCYLMQVYMQLN